MDYALLQKELAREALSRKQYKNLNPIFRILSFIGVLPFIGISALLFVCYSIFVFFFKLFSSGACYLEEWVNKTKEGASAPAEAVIYLVTTPIIFMWHVALSILSLNFFILWFCLQSSLYIATLGGIKWQPYITSTGKNPQADEYIIKTNKIAASILSVAIFMLFITVFALGITCSIRPFSIVTVFSVITNPLYFMITCVSIPVVFHKSPIINDEEKEETKRTRTQITTAIISIVLAASLFISGVTTITIEFITNSGFSIGNNFVNKSNSGSSYENAIVLSSSSSYEFTANQNPTYFKFTPSKTGTHYFQATSSVMLNISCIDSSYTTLKTGSGSGIVELSYYLYSGGTYYFTVTKAKGGSASCSAIITK